MNLYDYWRGLSKEEKTSFAATAEVSEQYIETHLIHRRKQPQIKTMRALADASEGEMTYDDLFEFFYSEKVTA